MAQLEWGSVTHEGQIRTANEDSLLVEPGVFVVADGMGGHQAGEVASALAVERIRRNLLGKPGVLDAVITAINDANADIHEAASGDETKQGMGTTVTALAVIATPNGDEALGLANVGDSRTYLFRHERLRPITVDHNYVQELIDSGQITPDEARQHPRRNIITRALGIESGVRVDAWTMPLVRGDRFLLCSDGLVDEVTDEDIAHVLATHPDPQRTAERLVEMANDSGGRDNITVIVVDVLDGSEPPAHDEMDLEPIWATTGASRPVPTPATNPSPNPAASWPTSCRPNPTRHVHDQPRRPQRPQRPAPTTPPPLTGRSRRSDASVASSPPCYLPPSSSPAS